MPRWYEGGRWAEIAAGSLVVAVVFLGIVLPMLVVGGVCAVGRLVRSVWRFWPAHRAALRELAHSVYDAYTADPLTPAHKRRARRVDNKASLDSLS